MSGFRARFAPRRAQFWMVAGLLSSFLGSKVIDGSVNGLIAVGFFPLLWIPLYATLTEIEDALAPVVSSIVARFRPGRVLALAEGADCVLTLAALAAVLTFPSATVIVLVSYLLATSLIPLVVDVAEEFYLNDLSQHDERSVIRANVLLGTGTLLMGTLLGRPLGAISSVDGIAIALVINLILSALAVALRVRSSMVFDPARTEPEGSEDTSGIELVRGKFLPGSLSIILFGGHLAPIVSGMTAFATALTASYLPLWIAGSDSDAANRLALVLLVLGAATIAGPWLAGKLMNAHPKQSARLLPSFATLSLLGYLVSIGSLWFIETAGVSRYWVLVGFSVVALSWIFFRFTLSASRQVEMKPEAFKRVIGWSFSLSAIGGLAGSWVGFALAAASNPVWALSLAFAVAALIAVVTARRKLANGR